MSWQPYALSGCGMVIAGLGAYVALTGLLTGWAIIPGVGAPAVAIGLVGMVVGVVFAGLPFLFDWTPRQAKL